MYGEETVTLKQLKTAFSDHSTLTRILEDKDCIDWRLLFDENFLDEEKNAKLNLATMEDDDLLSFRVPNLILFGILYCKSDA